MEYSTHVQRLRYTVVNGLRMREPRQVVVLARRVLAATKGWDGIRALAPELVLLCRYGFVKK